MTEEEEKAEKEEKAEEKVKEEQAEREKKVEEEKAEAEKKVKEAEVMTAESHDREYINRGNRWGDHTAVLSMWYLDAVCGPLVWLIRS